MKRAATIQLPEQEVPMFPKRLHDFLSFSKDGNDEVRFAITIGVKLQRDGSIEQYVLTPSYVQDLHRITYTEMDDLLLGLPERQLSLKAKEIRENHFQTWAKLEELAEKRKKFRTKRDAVHIHLPQPEVYVRSKRGNSEVEITVTPNPFRNSRGIIKELSLLAGECIASFAEEREVPMIFTTMRKMPPQLDFEPSNDPLEDRIRQVPMLILT